MFENDKHCETLIEVKELGGI